MDTQATSQKKADIRDIPVFKTPNQLAAEMGLSISILRKWLFFRETNGLGSAVFQIGRKLLIQQDRFIAWIQTHQAGKN